MLRSTLRWPQPAVSRLLPTSTDRRLRRFVALWEHSAAGELGWTDGRHSGVGQLDRQVWLGWLHAGRPLGLVAAWLLEHEVCLDAGARELEAVLVAIAAGDFDGAFRLADGSVLCSFERLSAAIGIEGPAARVMVHALETVGALQRGDDFTLGGTILLNVPGAAVADHLAGEDAEVFAAIAEDLQLAVDRRASYSAFDAARLIRILGGAAPIPNQPG